LSKEFSLVPKNPYKNILDAVGKTPIIRLKKSAAGLKPEIFAKLEFLNPMGSIKAGNS